MNSELQEINQQNLFANEPVGFSEWEALLSNQHWIYGRSIPVVGLYDTLGLGLGTYCHKTLRPKKLIGEGDKSHDNARRLVYSIFGAEAAAKFTLYSVDSSTGELSEVNSRVLHSPENQGWSSTKSEVDLDDEVHVIEISYAGYGEDPEGVCVSWPYLEDEVEFPK